MRVEGSLPWSPLGPRMSCGRGERAGVSEGEPRPAPLPRVAGVREAGRRRLAGWTEPPLSCCSQQRPQGPWVPELQIPGGRPDLGPQVKFGCCPGAFGCEMSTGSLGFDTPSPCVPGTLVGLFFFSSSSSVFRCLLLSVMILKFSWKIPHLCTRAELGARTVGSPW